MHDDRDLVVLSMAEMWSVALCVDALSWWSVLIQHSREIMSNFADLLAKRPPFPFELVLLSPGKTTYSIAGCGIVDCPMQGLRLRCHPIMLIDMQRTGEEG